MRSPKQSISPPIWGVSRSEALPTQEGIDEVREAIRLSTWRHYYYFDLGMIYLISGERKKGLEEIKKASQLFPLNENYHQWLRSIYLEMGEQALAFQEEQWIERIQRGEME